MESLARRQSSGVILVAALFFFRYTFPPAGSVFSPTLAEIPLGAAYVAVFLGAPVAAYDLKLAAAAGTLACGALAWLVVQLLGGGRRSAERALPWIAFAGYGIGSATLAAAGRLKFGLELAISSRYVTFASFFWLGLLGLALLWLEEREGRATGRAMDMPVRLAGAAVAVSLVAGSIWGGFLIHEQYVNRTRVREALREGGVPADLLLFVPGKTVPLEELHALERHRLSLFRSAR